MSSSMGPSTGMSIIRSARDTHYLRMTLQRVIQVPFVATALTPHPAILAAQQERTLFCGGRRRDPDWRQQGGLRHNRSVKPANWMVYKNARTVRGQSPWWGDIRKNDQICNRQRFGHRKLSKKPKENESSFWGWDLSSLGKEYSAENARIEREFQHLKRRIDADPYGVVFGRRLQPFAFGQRGIFSSLCQSLFGCNDSDNHSVYGESKSPTNSKDLRQTDIRAEKGKFNSSDAEIVYEFDPISGRMVPSKVSSTSVNSQNSHDDGTVNIPVGKYKTDDRELGSKKPTTPKKHNLNERQPSRGQSHGRPETKHTLSGNSDNKRTRIDNKGLSTDLLQQGHNLSGSDIATTNMFPKNMNENHSPKAYLGPDKQAANSPSRNNVPSQAIFSKYKDYITSRPEDFLTEGQPSLVKNNNNKCTKPILGPDQLSEKVFPYQNAEKDDLDSLRACDVRRSFEHRTPNPDPEDSNAVPQSMQKAKPINEIQPDHSQTPCNRKSSETISTKEDFERQTPGSGKYSNNVNEASNRRNQSNAKDKAKSPYLHDPKISITVASDGYKIQELVDNVDELNRSTSNLIAEFREAIQQNVILNASSPPSRAAVHSEGSVSPEHADQYRILAYDSSTRQVRDAGITAASAANFTPLNPVEAISRLSNPTLFLDFFPSLEEKGYELFSAGTEVLIFKKARKVGDPIVPVKDEVASASKQSLHSPRQAAEFEQESMDEIESTSETPTAILSPSSSDLASPEMPTTSTASSKKGNSNIWKSLKKVTRRVLLAGVATGATVYAMGVVAEYFRTGGQDGLGPRGFTGLEGR